jgi:hypothetical protein
MKTYRGSGCIDPRFLDLYYFKVSGQLHASAALPSEKDPCTNWVGGLVDPKTGLDDMEK